MTSCKNVLEDLVVEEAKAQIHRLGTGIQAQVNLNEVVAYALNRLPPMYVTTQHGWLRQRRFARTELGQQISNSIRQALLGVRRDPLHDSSPLPENELESKARSLAKLQNILHRDNLTWKEVPQAVEVAIDSVRVRGSVTSRVGLTSSRSAFDIKGYLSRSKTKDPYWRVKQSVSNISGEALKEAVDSKDFKQYMSSAGYSFRNIMETLVMSIAERYMQRLSPDVTKRITLEEVAAYALNRLPPMYATTASGFRKQRLRAKAELSREIIEIVRQAIFKVGQAPDRLLPPLPFDKFDQDIDQTLVELKRILRRDDINWRNIADVVAEVLEDIRTNYT